MREEDKKPRTENQEEKKETTTHDGLRMPMISLGKKIRAKGRRNRQPSLMPSSQWGSESCSRKISKLAVCAGFADLIEDLRKLD